MGYSSRRTFVWSKGSSQPLETVLFSVFGGLGVGKGVNHLFVCAGCCRVPDAHVVLIAEGEKCCQNKIADRESLGRAQQDPRCNELAKIAPRKVPRKI